LNADKAAADKILAGKQAPLDSAIAKVQALKAEAIAIEKKRADAGRAGRHPRPGRADG
jgi:hypothetical protein